MGDEVESGGRTEGPLPRRKATDERRMSAAGRRAIAEATRRQD